jgi:hypothetical protein
MEGTKVTLGSLFDGAGGFPLAATMAITTAAITIKAIITAEVSTNATVPADASTRWNRESTCSTSLPIGALMIGEEIALVSYYPGLRQKLSKPFNLRS